jgi:hypothetical protein
MGLAQGKRAFIAFVARQIEATLRGCSLTDDRVPTLKWGMRMIRSFAAIAGPILIATLGAAAANAQRLAPPGQSVTAYVVMTPNGPATCATWTQWRAPGANTTDKEGIQYWAEGYISGLAAGSRHDVLAQFQLRDLAAWLDRYCAANPQTKLPLALNALGREMLAHPGGKL